MPHMFRRLRFFADLWPLVLDLAGDPTDLDDLDGLYDADGLEETEEFDKADEFDAAIDPISALLFRE